LSAFLYRLREMKADNYRNIVDAVRLVAPFFHDFNLRPDRLNPRKIRLEWQEVGSDSYFDAHALSDGTLRFVCLATLLLQPVPPTTILIDEPELGLHPYAITVLAELFRATAHRAQLLVSTQSVTLVNQLEPQDVIVAERREGESVFRRLEDEEIATWLDDYALGELWEKNVLGGRPTS
jgi:predicted ATPase